MRHTTPTTTAGGGISQSLRRVSGFRTKVLIAMMLVVSAVIALALYLAERNLALNFEEELQRDFASELAELHNAQAVRHAALVERCRALVRKPRIHAALEDNALDLLYPNAEDELRDIMSPADATTDPHAQPLRAKFYRFLNRDGQVIRPPVSAPVGVTDPASDGQLALPAVTDVQQVGYVLPAAATRDNPVEIIATPILSTESGEPIAALLLGFKPLEVVGEREMQSGLWVDGRLHFPTIPAEERANLEAEAAKLAATNSVSHRRVTIGGVVHLLFVQQLNPGAAFPPAFELSLYSLKPFLAAEARLRFRILAAGFLLLVVALFASKVIADRLSAPVEKLAIDSERSARFSADASHQLKTPVTVLRAGLEELMTRENLTPDECDAISALIHQTYRLSSLIDDLLLLSRMDSGRLKLTLQPVDLAHLIAAALDDLSATPDDMALEIVTEVPAELGVRGEQRYTAMILQNLLENARKYNRRNGVIKVVARVEGEDVFLNVGNTGRPIPPAAQTHIFERFHRGGMGENVPGYGLGLNLARELARLHEGELRLVRSNENWTEFELRFRVAHPTPVPV